jgi:TatD DNase family protein
MVLFDAHNHLQDEWLAPYLPEIFETLEGIGIGGAVVNGTTVEDWEAVARLGRERAWVIPSYGLHPWYIKDRPADWEEQLRTRLDDGGAVGEIGLDRWIEGYDFEDQQAVFRAQLRLAAARNVPATIHCLQAWGALADILREEPVPECGFLIHAYGGPAEMIRAFAEHGAYFSFNGYFLDPARHRKLETFREVPPDRLLVETDAPAMPLPVALNRYPLPDTSGGKPVNHPGNLPVAYEGLAELRGMSVAELADQVTENFQRLFSSIRSSS